MIKPSKHSPLTHFGDISILESSPILGIARKVRIEMTTQSPIEIDLPITLLECESKGAFF
jgi:hypothetical protein